MKWRHRGGVISVMAQRWPAHVSAASLIGANMSASVAWQRSCQPMSQLSMAGQACSCGSEMWQWLHEAEIVKYSGGGICCRNVIGVAAQYGGYQIGNGDSGSESLGWLINI
jgi:hypothetical protein